MFSQSQWRSIEEFVNRIFSKRGEPFVQGVVIKTDPVRKVVFLKEFGHTPVPLVAFHMQVKYSYKEPSGSTTIKTTRAYSNEVEILTPRVGDTVLVAQHYGVRRLPKCLGVIQSTSYVEVEPD